MMTERDFQPLQQGEWEDIYVPPQKLRQRSWQAMKKNKLAIIGLCIVLFMTIVAIVGPFSVPIPMPIRILLWLTAAHHGSIGLVRIPWEGIYTSAYCGRPNFLVHRTRGQPHQRLYWRRLWRSCRSLWWQG